MSTARDIHGPWGSDPPVTTVTSLVSRSGHEQAIAETFRRVFPDGSPSPHHLATLLIQQDNGVSFLVSHFRSRQALAAWHATPEHQRLIAGLEAHSVRELRTIDTPVAQIIVPSAASGPKWKGLVSSWIVTFPLLLGIVGILQVLLPEVPLLIRIAITSILMSVAITWVIAPVVLRLTRTWRLEDQQMKIIVVQAPGTADLSD